MPRNPDNQDKATIWRFGHDEPPLQSLMPRKPLRGHPMVAIMQDIATASRNPPSSREVRSADIGAGVPEDMQ